MRLAVFTILLLVLIGLPLACFGQTWLEAENVLHLNGIRFRINPYVQLRLDDQLYETLTFSSVTTSYADSCIIAYTNPKFSFTMSIADRQGFGSLAKQVRINSVAHQEIKIRDFKLNLDFLNDYSFHAFRGPKAIFSQNQEFNSQLTNYTDKAIQYNINNSRLWLIASNYDGCDNVDWLQEQSVCLYDHLCHMARLYNPVTDQFTKMIDTLKRREGDTNYWSFLIFQEQPVILSLNRWYDKNKAALVITNDADGEADHKLKAVYYGSNNFHSPKYKTTGLVANNIKVTNTVFGASQTQLDYLWHEIMSFGNSIGYHTHSAGTDYSADTYNSLINNLRDFHIRTWIDHSWVTNFETLCHQGGDPNSPYYVIDAINDSNLDYFWLGDNISTNPLNSFTEPGRLPHRLYEFDTLTRPLWFFGRAKMQAWEYYGWNFQVDMKHNLTPENLDKLINENGLCVSYTHFGFDNSANISAFFEYTDTGDCEIKDEVNDRLIMLDYYQKNRGLWIDTLENVFDRMIAMEDVKISSVTKTSKGEVATIILANHSGYPLEKANIKYYDQEISLPLFAPNSHETITLTGEAGGYIAGAELFSFYQDKALNFKRVDNDYIQPLSISIYNLKGQLLKTHQMREQTRQISVPLENCSSGVYFTLIKDMNGFQKTLKFYILK